MKKPIAARAITLHIAVGGGKEVREEMGGRWGGRWRGRRWKGGNGREMGREEVWEKGGREEIGGSGIDKMGREEM